VLTRGPRGRPRCHCPGRVDSLTPRASPGLTAFRGWRGNTVVPSARCSLLRHPPRTRTLPRLAGSPFGSGRTAPPRRAILQGVPRRGHRTGGPQLHEHLGAQPRRTLFGSSCRSAPSYPPHQPRLASGPRAGVAAIVAAILAAQRPGRHPLPSTTGHQDRVPCRTGGVVAIGDAEVVGIWALRFCRTSRAHRSLHERDCKALRSAGFGSSCRVSRLVPSSVSGVLPWCWASRLWRHFPVSLLSPLTRWRWQQTLVAARRQSFLNFMMLPFSVPVVATRDR
jgi:hypothetical protein